MQQEVYSKNFIDDVGNPSGGVTLGLGIDVVWQNGPLGTGADRKEPNGAFVEGVIQAAFQRLAFYQASKFKCDENEEAMKHLLSALNVLGNRTKSREQRNVEGTHQV